jgi:hypothetical protein
MKFQTGDLVQASAWILNGKTGRHCYTGPAVVIKAYEPDWARVWFIALSRAETTPLIRALQRVKRIEQ